MKNSYDKIFKLIVLFVTIIEIYIYSCFPVIENERIIKLFLLNGVPLITCLLLFCVKFLEFITLAEKNTNKKNLTIIVLLCTFFWYFLNNIVRLYNLFIR